MNIDTLSLYNKKSAVVEFSECDDLIRIKTPSHDEGFGLIVKNNGASDADIIIKGGNSVLAMGDTYVLADSGDTVLINLKDTGRYKNVHGEDAGYILIEIGNASPSDIEIFPFSL